MPSAKTRTRRRGWECEPVAGRPKLRRELGLRDAVALGVGGTIGGGVFVLVGVAAGAAGPGALVSFALAFAAALTIALPYAELACRYPSAGGGYASVQAVLGSHWGFLMGWGLWGAYLFASGYVTIGFGGYLSRMTGLPPMLGIVALVTVITAVNLAGVRVSGRVQSAVILLGIAALATFGILGLPSVEVDRLDPFFPEGFGGVAQASLLAFLAFGGFDMVAAAGEEVADPKRNLPRAILLTLVSVLGLYLLVTFVAVGVLPYKQLGVSPAPLAAAATAFLGPAGGNLVAAAALLTAAATANAVLVVTSRVSFAMARDGLLPTSLSRVREATGVPWVAVLLNGSLLGLVALLGSVKLVAAVGGFLYVLHFLPPLYALVILRRQDGPPPDFRTPIPTLVLPLAFLACLLLLAAGGRAGIPIGIGWLLVGLFAYGATRTRRVD